MNWVQRRPPEKFEFGPGAVLVGVLVRHGKVNLKDPKTGALKPANKFFVQVEPGEVVFFHATVQLDEQIYPEADIGHFISITCTGENRLAGRNGNAMKLFDVKVSEHAAPGWANDGTRITDDDLPDDSFMA